MEASRVSSSGDLLARIGKDRVPALTNAEADSSIELSPSDYFLLSRVDGRTPIGLLRQMTGMGTDAFDETFVKILASGLVRVPGVPRTEALDIVLARMTGSHELLADEPAAQASLSGPSPAVADEGSTAPDSAAPAAQVEESEPPAVDAEVSTETAEPLESGAAPRANPPPPVAESLDTLEGYLRAASRDDVELPKNEFTRRPSTAGNRQYEPLPNQTPRKKKPTVPKLKMDILPPGWPVPIQQFTFDPVTMATGDALNTEQKQVVLYYHYHLRRVTYYALFGIQPGASRREVKNAYFALSKAFHPDRWYRQDTGEFGEMIEDVFKWLNRAYGVLSSPRKRKGYDKLVARGYIGEWQLERSAPAQPRREPAKSQESPGRATDSRRTLDVLSARARRAANDGEWEEACDLYLRLLEMNDTAELRIRLVECMLKANMEPHEVDRQLAPAASQETPTVPVMLLEAEVARRLDDLTRAEACFLRVLEIEPANPVARLGLERIGAGDPPA